MSFGNLDGLPLKAIQRDLYRNIVSLRHSQDLFDDLSDDPEDWQAAIELEQLCKPVCYRSEQPILHRPFEEAEHFSAIDLPFQRLGESRFSTGRFGVWYGSGELETTIYETVHHWRHGLLADAGYDHEEVVIQRRVHLVGCDAALIDLIQRAPSWPELRSEEYQSCQRLGATLHHQGHPGLWTPSARCQGHNAAILNPRVLHSPRIYCYLTYRLKEGQVSVYRDPDELLLTIS